ncbi:class I SAM-dependent methyltransferase [bacterium]|nr:class I SAM-dependent methyltransferase [bacterium]
MPNWTQEAPIANIPCPLCSEGVRRRIVDTVWDAPEAAVYQCTACEIVFVHPIMTVAEEEAFYAAEFASYMKQRGGAGETRAVEHFQKNSGEATRRLANLRPYLKPDMHVLEIGSSTGFLLHALAPNVASVTGVEPGQVYAEYANQRGILTHASLQAVAEQRFDLILGYYVLEHLRNPIEYLRQLYELLRPGGRLVLEVPNVEDALVHFYQLESFDRFYWQKAHYFNYSHKTLERVLTTAGFQVRMIPEHRYDISNHIHWLLAGQPGGKGKYCHVFDDALNREYARCLKEQWLCDTVMAIATKSA